MMALAQPTPHPALLLRAQTLWRDLVHATVIVRATFHLRADGAAVPADVQEPVATEDAITPWGVVDHDLVPAKPGCDLVVLGPAVTPRRVATLDVVIRLGPFVRRVRVTGDRVWTRRRGDFVPSPPIPFEEQAIDWTHAYGGTAHRSEPLAPGAPPVEAYAPNPIGRGYVVRAECVEGAPLPNVEEIDQLVRDWRDRPLPAALTAPPRASCLRGEGGIAPDPATGSVHLGPGAFAASHPRMRLSAWPGGAAASVEGLTPEGPLRFEVPELPLRATVRLGGRAHELHLPIDTAILVPRERRLSLVARRGFVYQIRPERQREVVVEVAAAREAPLPRLAALLEHPDPEVPLVPESTVLPVAWLRARQPLGHLVEYLPVCPSA